MTTVAFHPNNSQQHNKAQLRIANLLEKYGYQGVTTEKPAGITSNTPLGPKQYQWDVWAQKVIHHIPFPDVVTLSDYEALLESRKNNTTCIAVEIRNKDGKTKWADYKRKLKTEYSLQQGVRIHWVDIHDVVGKKKLSDEQLALELEL